MEKDYTDNNPFRDTIEIHDVETEKELVLKAELKDLKIKKSKTWK